MLIAITYKNRDTFIAVVAWVLILYGAFGVYGSLSQLTLLVWLPPTDTVPVFSVTVVAVNLFFSSVSVWCGLGLRTRQRSRLEALVIFLWIYIVWLVGLNIWYYIDHFILSAPPDSPYPGLLETLERAERYNLANMVTSSIRVVLESAVIVWIIGQLSSSLIQDEFKD